MIQLTDCEQYYDIRGCINPIFRATDHPVKFVEDRISRSFQNVLRGFHCDFQTYKLFTCLVGKIQFVMVSNTGSVYNFQMSGDKIQQILIPPNYFNAHLCLSPSCLIHYKWSKYYSLQDQITVKWDDPTLNVPWVIRNPILSDRDKNGLSWKEFNENH